MKTDVKHEPRVPVVLRAAALALGLTVAVLLVTAGLAGDSGDLLHVLIVIMLLPAVLLAMQLARATRRPGLVFTVVPVTAGLVTVTWLVGRAWLADQPAWWWPAALVSALPLCLLAVVPARDDA